MLLLAWCGSLVYGRNPRILTCCSWFFFKATFHFLFFPPLNVLFWASWMIFWPWETCLRKQASRFSLCSEGRGLCSRAIPCSDGSKTQATAGEAESECPCWTSWEGEKYRCSYPEWCPLWKACNLSWSGTELLHRPHVVWSHCSLWTRRDGCHVPERRTPETCHSWWNHWAFSGRFWRSVPVHPNFPWGICGIKGSQCLTYLWKCEYSLVLSWCYYKSNLLVPSSFQQLNTCNKLYSWHLKHISCFCKNELLCL